MPSSTRPIDVVVCGHLCIDLLPAMAQVPLEALNQPGRLFETGGLSVSTGGAVSNTGLALHQLGVNTRLMAIVGDDMIGGMTLEFIRHRSETLPHSIQVRTGLQSSYTIVLSPERVDRIFLHYPGANAHFGAADVDYKALESTKIFHFGYPPILPRMMLDDGVELAEIFRTAYDTGVITSLDMSLPDPSGAGANVDWRKLLRNTLPYVDIFIPSIDEILYMLEPDEYHVRKRQGLKSLSFSMLDALAEQLLEIGGCALVGFKLGEAGLYLKTANHERLVKLSAILPMNLAEWGDQRIWHPAFEVTVVGTTGAGDAAYAGILTGLLNGLSPYETLKLGCAVGASSVEVPDATSGVRSLQDTNERLLSVWRTLDPLRPIEE